MGQLNTPKPYALAACLSVLLAAACLWASLNAPATFWLNRAAIDPTLTAQELAVLMGLSLIFATSASLRSGTIRLFQKSRAWLTFGTLVQTQAGAGRLQWLDGWRAFAMLTVTVFHAFCRTGDILPSPATWVATLPFYWLALMGHLAVDLFITISGFCLILPVLKDGGLKGGAVGFYKRRAWRILPPYWVAILAAGLIGNYLIMDPTLRMNGHQLTWAIFRHVILIQDYFKQDIAGVFWSIAVECHIYLLLPLIVILWRRYGPAKTLAICALPAVALSLMVESDPVFMFLSPQYLCLFLFGALAAWLAQNGLTERIRKALLASVVVLGAWTYYQAFSQGWMVGQARSTVFDLAFGLVAATALYFSATTTLCQKPFSCKFLAWVGSFSYSAYLLQWLLIYPAHWAATLFHAPALLRTANVLFCIAFILVVGYAFHLVFERSFMRPLKRRERITEVAVIAST